MLAWSRVGRVGFFFSHGMAAFLNDDPLPEMHQPVDQGRCHDVVHSQEGAPFPEGSIRREHDRSEFITGGDNLEQQIGSALVDGQTGQLIEKEKTGTVETLDACVPMYRFTGNKTKNETDFFVRLRRKRKNPG